MRRLKAHKMVAKSGKRCKNSIQMVLRFDLRWWALFMDAIKLYSYKAGVIIIYCKQVIMLD